MPCDVTENWESIACVHQRSKSCCIVKNRNAAVIIPILAWQSTKIWILEAVCLRSHSYEEAVLKSKARLQSTPQTQCLNKKRGRTELAKALYTHAWRPEPKPFQSFPVQATTVTGTLRSSLLQPSLSKSLVPAHETAGRRRTRKCHPGWGPPGHGEGYKNVTVSGNNPETACS